MHIQIISVMWLVTYTWIDNHSCISIVAPPEFILCLIKVWPLSLLFFIDVKLIQIKKVAIDSFERVMVPEIITALATTELHCICFSIHVCVKCIHSVWSFGQCQRSITLKEVITTHKNVCFFYTFFRLISDDQFNIQ